MKQDLINLSRYFKKIKNPKYPSRIFYGRGQKYSQFSWLVIDYYIDFILVTFFVGKSSSRLEKEKIDQSIAVLKPFLQELFPNLKIKFHISSDPFFNYNDHDLISENLIINEDNLSYQIQINKNQNVGLFISNEALRSWVIKNAENKKILNLFSYTSVLGLSAVKSGAKQVINIDMSKKTLDWAKSNFKLNKITPRQFLFLKRDILKNLNGISKNGPYDIIIIDPPTKQEKSFRYREDYQKIIKKIPTWLRDKNSKALLTCHDPFIGTQTFKNWINENINLKIIETLYSDDIDFFEDKSKAPRFFVISQNEE